jgi:CheY-specific phosphatase CheX
MENSNYAAYSRILTKSVNHIFKKFLNDTLIEEVFETQAGQRDPQVAVEINGTLKGEVIINIPQKTLAQISKYFVGDPKAKLSKSIYVDVAGELANLITGTFANYMQYANHDIRLSPPAFNEDPISIKALYENVNMSFNSSFGGFDVDLYYRDN